MATADERALLDTVLGNPVIRAVWRNWHLLELPDCWLVAGCVARTAWNHRFGLPPGNGISDIDIVYFYPEDTSESEEQRRAERVRHAFPELG